MQDIFQQIRDSNKAGFYYVALISALAIPDICAGLESTNGETSKNKYISWFNTHIAPKYNNFLDGETCYYFRCSMLHQGSTKHSKSRYTRIIFIEPNNHDLVLHNNIINDALNIDVRIFCEDICLAAERWWQAASSQPICKINFSHFVTRYPKGLPPYIVGIPVIG